MIYIIITTLWLSLGTETFNKSIKVDNVSFPSITRHALYGDSVHNYHMSLSINFILKRYTYDAAGSIKNLYFKSHRLRTNN